MLRQYLARLLLAAASCLLLPSLAAQDTVTKIAGGFGFVEGPAWDPIHKRLLFSDIRNDRINQLRGGDQVSTYLQGSGRSNGLAFDREGNLYACLGGARQVGVRTACGRR